MLKPARTPTNAITRQIYTVSSYPLSLQANIVSCLSIVQSSHQATGFGGGMGGEDDEEALGEEELDGDEEEGEEMGGEENGGRGVGAALHCEA